MTSVFVEATVVVVPEFGGPEKLTLARVPMPGPGAGEVLIRMTGIGMNHADLMARRGAYRIASGDPPFVPGLEGGGVIEAVGPGIQSVKPGDRVILTPEAPRREVVQPQGAALPVYNGGTYRSHYLCAASDVMLAPAALDDAMLGCVWLPYLTAWGCLVWKQNLQAGQVVGIPAGSSSVGIAAAQIARLFGAVPIGLTTRQEKADALARLCPDDFAHLIVTHDDAGTMRPWHQEIKRITQGRGVDVYFDPVAAGDYLSTEIRTLAQSGTIWVYGLLGKPGPVDVQPLIRKWGALRGWVLSELVAQPRSVWEPMCAEVLSRLSRGELRLVMGGTYALKDVARAHREMESGVHVGKLALTP